MHLTMAYLRLTQVQTAYEAFEWLIDQKLLPATFDSYGAAEEFVGVATTRRAQNAVVKAEWLKTRESDKLDA